MTIRAAAVLGAVAAVLFPSTASSAPSPTQPPHPPAIGSQPPALAVPTWYAPDVINVCIPT